MYIVNGGSVKSYNIYVYVSGASEKSLGYKEYYSGNHTLIEATYSVNHNEDGSGSASVSGYFHGGFGSWDLSGNLTLTKINRSFTSTPQITNTSKTAHSLTFSWTTSENCSKIIASVNGTGSQVWNGNAKTGTFTVNNLTPDTDYQVFGDFTRQDTGVSRISNKLTVKTKKVPTRIRVNGVWKEAMPYVRVNGVWKEAKPYVRVNNQWKEGI